MSETEIFSTLAQFLREGRTAALCTIVEKVGSAPRGVGAKMLVGPDGGTLGTVGGWEMVRRVKEEALAALKEGRPRVLTFALGVEPREGGIEIDSKCGGEVKVLVDVVRAEPRLIVVGSGAIAKPLAEFAARAGFAVVVVDDAPTASRERFPAAELRNGPFEEELERLELRPSDLVAIVHGETGHEQAALRRMLRQRPAYIGVLGSRRKAEGHKRQLLAAGFGQEEVDAIRGPIGLAIGAQTPEEIALSIVAELIKERRRG